jgi:hypothetical protein
LNHGPLSPLTMSEGTRSETKNQVYREAEKRAIRRHDMFG